MISQIAKFLSCPIVVLSGITIFSITALAAAFSSEAFLGLEPCIMCIYQRYPYAAIIAFGIIGLAFRKNKAIPPAMLGLSAATFFINSIIAMYHTGIELKWWESHFEGCSVPQFSAEPQSILENILSAPSARCDEIPWADPIFNLSMANYNAIFCLGLAILCAISLKLILKSRNTGL